jgi:hypothetical protein
MTFFQFEADFVDNLRCIPMVVRYKLDTCGVKLKLPDWNGFSQAERQQLVDFPCETDVEIANYRQMVHQRVAEHGGDRPKDLPLDPNPEWHNKESIPPSVQEQSRQFNVSLTLQQWDSLTPLQRFALIKLSRSNHENRNFLPALKEFNLV